MTQTNGGLVILSEMKDQLPKSEQKIADFILKDPSNAVTYTASQLAEKSSTSSAAVIRLCKSLGLKGFQELKLRIAGDLQKKIEIGYRDIDPNEPQEMVVEKVTTNSIQAIRETTEILNTKELSNAVDALKNAENIHFFGVGASGIIAQDAQQKFLRIDKNATAFLDFHMVAMLIANVKEDDVVVGISFSGETKEVAQILELANQKGAVTISLTKYGANSVSKHASIKLNTSASREATFRSGATSSRLAQLHIIDILFMSVASQQFEKTVKRLDQTRESIEFIRRK